MQNDNDISEKNEANDNLKQINIKCILITIIIFIILEIVYFTFLYISNTLYLVSLVVNIIKFIFIFVLFISILFINPYHNIRISLKSTKFFKIEKNLALISMISSVLVVLVGFISYIIIIKPQCPYLEYCELKKNNFTDSKTNYRYFCNYQPDKNSNNIDVNSCMKSSNNEAPDSLQYCKNVYTCELTAATLKEINNNGMEASVLSFGLVLFCLWLIIMGRCINNFRIITRNDVLIEEKEPIKYELKIMKSKDNYSYALCDHNNIEDKFDFDYDNVELVICDQHGNDTMKLNNKNLLSRSNTELANSLSSSTNRMNRKENEQ